MDARFEQGDRVMIDGGGLFQWGTVMTALEGTARPLVVIVALDSGGFVPCIPDVLWTVGAARRRPMCQFAWEVGNA